MSQDKAAVSRWSWVEVIVPVRVGLATSAFILMGRRHGGQRYLADDLDALGPGGRRAG